VFAADHGVALEEAVSAFPSSGAHPSPGSHVGVRLEQPRMPQPCRWRPKPARQQCDSQAMRLSRCIVAGWWLRHRCKHCVHAVTLAVYQSIAAGLAACCVLAKSSGATLDLVDVGVLLPPAPVDTISGAAAADDAEAGAGRSRADAGDDADLDCSDAAHARVSAAASGGAAAVVPAKAAAAPLPATVDAVVTVRPARVANGSANMARAPAMSEAELDAALEAGREAGRSAAAAGAQVVCAGEIGIGNTTAAAALLAGLTGASSCALMHLPDPGSLTAPMHRRSYQSAAPCV
jgi:Phosphoribosyltransferase